MRKSSPISALIPKKGGFGEAGTSRNGTWGKADRWKECEERGRKEGCRNRNGGGGEVFPYIIQYTHTHTHTHTLQLLISPSSPPPLPFLFSFSQFNIRGPRSAVKNEKEI